MFAFIIVEVCFLAHFVLHGPVKITLRLLIGMDCRTNQLFYLSSLRLLCIYGLRVYHKAKKSRGQKMFSNARMSTFVSTPYHAFDFPTCDASFRCESCVFCLVMIITCCRFYALRYLADSGDLIVISTVIIGMIWPHISAVHHECLPYSILDHESSHM